MPPAESTSGTDACAANPLKHVQRPDGALPGVCGLGVLAHRKGHPRPQDKGTLRALHTNTVGLLPPGSTTLRQ